MNFRPKSLHQQKRIQHVAMLMVLLSLGNTLLQAQTIFPEPLSERTANYKIDVALDHEKRMATGTEVLTWKNPSTDTIKQLQFHLYLNAYKNSNSTFLKEADGFFRNLLIGDRDDPLLWGGQTVKRIQTEAGEDLTANMHYIHPDDDNDQDQTVLAVELNTPVLPNETLVLTLEFEAKIPKIMSRTGYGRDYYFMAQWYPKLGVYEPKGMRQAPKGRWNCHQFHARTEFYGDFGVYDVNITIPQDYKIGSTGLRQKEIDNKNGTKTYTYHAEDVIDFTWTASPAFVEVTDKWEHIDLRLLTVEDKKSFAPRYMKAAKFALSYLDKHVGKYPYPNLTIVDPPFYGTGSSGMEYPTLVTGGALCGIPEGIRMPETLAVHEITHQYFMQMVATNEFEEAWMDEGFTTYWESRILNHGYGDKQSTFDMFGMKYGNKEDMRLGYTSMENPKLTISAQPGWYFKHGGYGGLVYNKVGTWLTTLEGMVGQEVMDEVMQAYFERWKFKHPCGQDFIDVANEIIPKYHTAELGNDLNWFFDQVLYGTDVCDYAVSDVRISPVYPPAGIFDGENGEQEFVYDTNITGGSSKNQQYRNRIVLERKGELIFPVDIIVGFENGEEVREKWDGKSRTHEFSYTRPDKVEWVKIDPEQKIYMDIDFNNNSYTLAPKTSPIWKVALRAMNWFQTAMQTLAAFV